MEVKIVRRIAGHRPDGAVVLVDRALRASLSAGADAVGALLRWAAQRAVGMVAGAPSKTRALAAGVRTDAVPSAQPPAVVVIDHPHHGALPEGDRQTVRFGLDGQSYEIDLSDERATELRSALKRYVDAGRRVGQEPGRGITARSAQPEPRPARQQRHDPAAIREWARTHGHHVADRGRIPTNVVKAFAAEHRRSPTLTAR